MKKVKVAIIGAGSSGLTARREVAKKTNSYVVINSGPLGTTCARVGCMPSKVLIQVANDFHRRKSFEQEGILGAGNLSIDPKKVMEHVRGLRDRFVRGVTNGMSDWMDNHFIAAKARFITPYILDCDGEEVQAEKIILATGSRPHIPDELKNYQDFFITTDDMFELEVLPKNLLVCGLGVIGLELGQALNRLGVNIFGVARRKSLGGISDPDIRDYAIEKISAEMNLSFAGLNKIERRGEKIWVQSGTKEFLADKILVTAGRDPNLSGLGLEKILNNYSGGVPAFHTNTFQLIEHNHIFIAGDITGEKQILHEASDEGRVVGYNSVNPIREFIPRTPLQVTFSDPNIACAGLTYNELVEKQIDFQIGKVTFEGQGRSIVKLKEIGLLHVYADTHTGAILGAEMFGPETEHIAHLLSWAIANKMTVNAALAMPFYHPVIEEGLRTAIRDLQSKLALPIPELEMEKAL